MRRWFNDVQATSISTKRFDNRLHSPAIHASSRAFPAGRDGIAPGYACISTVESDPSGSWGGNETISVGAETSHRGFIHAAL
jgi:hypothetical protein